MRYFLDFIRCISEENAIYTSQGFAPATNELLTTIKACVPFVFEKRMEGIDDAIDSSYAGKLVRDMPGDVFEKILSEIDPPFPVFSIECSGANGTDTHIVLYDQKDDKSVIAAFNLRDPDQMVLNCIVVSESAPKVFKTYAMFKCTWVSAGFQKNIIMDIGEKPFLNLVKVYLSYINQEKIGVDSTRIKTKLGNGKLKERIEIKKVVYVTPQKSFNESNFIGSKIDWTHRFEVRGHWRVQNGVGKDREGNYCVAGFTWVKHHVRGPESLPLVKKPRLVMPHEEFTTAT